MSRHTYIGCRTTHKDTGSSPSYSGFLLAVGGQQYAIAPAIMKKIRRGSFSCCGPPRPRLTGKLRGRIAARQEILGQPAQNRIPDEGEPAAERAKAARALGRGTPLRPYPRCAFGCA